MVDEPMKREVLAYWMNGVEDAEIWRTFDLSQEALDRIVVEMPHI